MMVPGRDRPKEKAYVIRLATQADAAAVNMLSRGAGLSDGEEELSVLESLDDEHTWIVLEAQEGVVIGAALRTRIAFRSRLEPLLPGGLQALARRGQGISPHRMGGGEPP